MQHVTAHGDRATSRHVSTVYWSLVHQRSQRATAHTVHMLAVQRVIQRCQCQQHQQQADNVQRPDPHPSRPTQLRSADTVIKYRGYTLHYGHSRGSGCTS